MAFGLNRIGQVAISVSDVNRAQDFYGRVLGLRQLYRFGDLAFFDCAGLRLMIERASAPDHVKNASTLYFDCADLDFAVAQLESRGVKFALAPRRVAQMEDHDLWMAFFADPDGHLLALMSEAPKGYRMGAAEA